MFDNEFKRIDERMEKLLEILEADATYRFLTEKWRELSKSLTLSGWDGNSSIQAEQIGICSNIVDSWKRSVKHNDRFHRNLLNIKETHKKQLEEIHRLRTGQANDRGIIESQQKRTFKEGYLTARAEDSTVSPKMLARVKRKGTALRLFGEQLQIVAEKIEGTHDCVCTQCGNIEKSEKPCELALCKHCGHQMQIKPWQYTPKKTDKLPKSCSCDKCGRIINNPKKPCEWELCPSCYHQMRETPAQYKPQKTGGKGHLPQDRVRIKP